MKDSVCIFWDNSNIHYSGLNQVLTMIEPGADGRLFRTYFKGLLELAQRGRTVKVAYLAGSIPPKNDSLWEHIRRQGFEVETLERTAANTENAVDVSIQTAMFRAAADTLGEKVTFVILTGDGAGGALGKGFTADLQRLHEKFKVAFELIAWETSCNRYLKQYAESNGTFVPLERYYYEVTFLEGGRRPKPLS